MKREYIGTGKTVDEAIEAACAALGCERSEIEFEILALAKKSFFGLRTTPAQVKVTWEDGTPDPRANRPQEGRREKKAEKTAESRQRRSRNPVRRMSRSPRSPRQKSQRNPSRKSPGPRRQRSPEPRSRRRRSRRSSPCVPCPS